VGIEKPPKGRIDRVQTQEWTVYAVGEEFLGDVVTSLELNPESKTVTVVHGNRVTVAYVGIPMAITYIND